MDTSSRWIRWTICSAEAVSRTAGTPRRAAEVSPLFGGSVQHQMERLILTLFTVSLASLSGSGRR
jgi:hypothetical protein